MAIPIVDSHIHLFPESHLQTLAWYSPDGPLTTQHSVDEYRDAASSEQSLRGFIFLETDRYSSVEERGQKHGWTHALDEVSFLARIASGSPVSDEGHKPEDSRLMLGIVPWAPLPAGVDVLERYMGLVKERAGTEDVWKKIRGVRYLVQDKPSRVMLQPAFIEGLKWLGEKGLTFDLGVDARSGGMWQLEEAVEMLQRVYEGVPEREQVTVVINHLCKPNLRLSDPTTSPDFLQWKKRATAMAQHPKTYMKLSGAFSELPPLSPDSDPDIPFLVERLQPWTDVVFDAFGSERVMFGSDWPICNVGGAGNQAWGRWKRVVEGLLRQRGLGEQQRRGFWGEVAVKAYGVTI